MSQSAKVSEKNSYQPAREEGLTRLIQRGYVFNARQQTIADIQRLSTGYRQLDNLLSGGLGLGALHEIQTPQPFSGESLLFKAALQHAHAQQQPVFWLNPPAQPFLPGLQVHKARHTILERLQDSELQWAATQILRELSAGVVLIWQTKPSADAIRQWQRAIQPGSQVYALVISQPMAQEARAYANRIRLHLDGGHVFFDVLKRQGGWPVQTSPERLRPWF